MSGSTSTFLVSAVQREARGNVGSREFCKDDAATRIAGLSGYLEVMRTANQEIVEVTSLPVDTQLSDPLCLAAKSLTVVTQRALVEGAN